MDPTLEQEKIDELLEAFNSHMINNPGAASGTITAGSGLDTVTLSSGLYSNTTITSSYPNTVSVTGGPYTIGTGTGISQPWFSNKASGKIRLDGEDADIEVNGESLIGMIKKIEERLNILTPNEKLEAEWEELRELGNRYRELEQHIKDKQATWDRLKAMPKVDVD